MGTAEVGGPPSPEATDSGVVFRYADAGGDVTRVRLFQEIARPRSGPEFRRVSPDRWELEWPRPQADRVEYMLEIERCDGTIELVTDPANDRSAPGPFGSKSVIEFPGYSPPAWTTRPAGGTLARHGLAVRALEASVDAHVWSPDGARADAPLPVLVVHDGPEYARYSGLTAFLHDGISRGHLPPLRAALLAPVERDEHYSASAPYARALAHELLPALARIAPSPPGRAMRAGMGASLGALAMLHAHRRHPETFGGLFLQSGSFFRQRFDPQESGFPRFRRISRFVGTVLAGTDWPHPIRVAMTCGTAEENLANNRAMAAALRAQGYAVDFRACRDAHNWVSWRDALAPGLTGLLTRLWGHP